MQINSILRPARQCRSVLSASGRATDLPRDLERG